MIPDVPTAVANFRGCQVLWPTVFVHCFHHFDEEEKFTRHSCCERQRLLVMQAWPRRLRCEPDRNGAGIRLSVLSIAEGKNSVVRTELTFGFSCLSDFRTRQFPLVSQCDASSSPPLSGAENEKGRIEPESIKMRLTTVDPRPEEMTVRPNGDPIKATG